MWHGFSAAGQIPRGEQLLWGEQGASPGYPSNAGRCSK